MGLLQTVEVHRDAEWNGDLVSPGVPLANGAGAVVYLVGHVVVDEVLAEPGDERGEVWIVGERQDGALEGGDDGRQGEVGPGLVPLPHLEVVLEDGVHHPAHAEGRLHHAGYELLHVEGLLVFLDGDHVLADGDALPTGQVQTGLTSSKISLQLCDLLQAQLGQHLRHIFRLFLECLAKSALDRNEFDCRM